MMKVKNVIIMVLVLTFCFASCDMHSYIVKEKILPLDYKGLCKSYKEYNPDTEIVFEREKTSTVLSKEEVVKKSEQAIKGDWEFLQLYYDESENIWCAAFYTSTNMKDAGETVFLDGKGEIIFIRYNGGLITAS